MLETRLAPRGPSLLLLSPKFPESFREELLAYYRKAGYRVSIVPDRKIRELVPIDSSVFNLVPEEGAQ